MFKYNQARPACAHMRLALNIHAAEVVKSAETEQLVINSFISLNVNIKNYILFGDLERRKKRIVGRLKCDELFDATRDCVYDHWYFPDLFIAWGNGIERMSGVVTNGFHVECGFHRKISPASLSLSVFAGCFNVTFYRNFVLSRLIVLFILLIIAK